MKIFFKKIYFLPCLCVFLIIAIFINSFLITKFNNISTINNLNKELVVHFLDVGQGDCILIQSYEKNILIDSGPNSASKKVIKYLKDLKIKKLDYVIVTHPHEDHIGSMDDILKNFTIENFYAPKIISSDEDFVKIIKELNKLHKKIIIARSDLLININPNTYLEFLSPTKKSYDNLNNYSAVVKLQFDEVAFLFTGDCEKVIEEELVKENINLKSQVLKIGHHGSKTSTSEDFIEKVAPIYGVISCGLGNDYGHPDKTTINLLNELQIKTYRTDKQGDILFTSEGKTLSIYTLSK